MLGQPAPDFTLPTAGGGESYDDDWSGLDPFREAGATHLTVIHTNDPVTANTDRFVQPIREAALRTPDVMPAPQRRPSPRTPVTATAGSRCR